LQPSASGNGHSGVTVSRSAAQLCFPFNYGDGDQSHFAAGSTPITDLAIQGRMCKGKLRALGYVSFAFGDYRGRQHEHSNVVVTAYSFHGTRVKSELRGDPSTKCYVQGL
jgi:hypothetical protein